jgi:hypothetical protein
MLSQHDLHFGSFSSRKPNSKKVKTILVKSDWAQILWRCSLGCFNSKRSKELRELKKHLSVRGFFNFHQNPQTLCSWGNYLIWLVGMFPMGPSTYLSIPIALKTLDSKKSWQLKEIGLGRWKTILIQTKDTQARSWTRDLEDMTSLWDIYLYGLGKKCLFLVRLDFFWTYLYCPKMKLSFFYGLPSVFLGLDSVKSMIKWPLYP